MAGGISQAPNHGSVIPDLSTIDLPAGTYAINAIGYLLNFNGSGSFAICQLIQVFNNGTSSGGNTGGIDIDSSYAAIPVQDTFAFSKPGKILLRCNNTNIDMLSSSTIQAIEIG